eukprot:568861-Prymnesium_polylepis.1
MDGDGRFGNLVEQMMTICRSTCFKFCLSATKQTVSQLRAGSMVQTQVLAGLSGARGTKAFARLRADAPPSHSLTHIATIVVSRAGTAAARISNTAHHSRRPPSRTH